MKSTYVAVRISYRMYITWMFASPSGIAPVYTITNHDTSAITWDRIRSPYRMTKCGIASSQLTSGRQFATFSGASIVSVAGCAGIAGCTRRLPSCEPALADN